MHFRQLLCFEVSSRMKEGTIYENVKEIFRAMMPIFNNENKSVITPLLCTGCQVCRINVLLFSYFSLITHYSVRMVTIKTNNVSVCVV